MVLAAGTAPSAPVNLVAIDRPGGVQLSWHDPLDTGGSALAGCTVLRGSSTTSLTPLPAVCANPFMDTSAPSGIRVFYAVRVSNAAATGPSSVPVAAAALVTPAMDWIGVYRGYLYRFDRLDDPFAPRSGLPAQAVRAAGSTNLNPAFSPDGKRLAYAAQGDPSVDPFLHLYVLDLVSGVSTQLTNVAATDSTPAWSPDGTTLVFYRNTLVAHFGLFTIPASGGVAVAVPNSTDLSYASYLPSGHELLACHTNQTRTSVALVTVRTDGTGRAVISGTSGACGSPALSPDGHRVAFARLVGSENEEIAVVPLAGGIPVTLARPGQLNGGLAWSPHMDAILFTHVVIVDNQPMEWATNTTGTGAGLVGNLSAVTIHAPAIADHTPPAAVTAVTTSQQATAVQLRWRNPSNGDWNRTVVCRAVGTTVPSPTTGPLLSDGRDISVTTPIRTNTLYTYALTAYDGAGNASPTVVVRLRTPVDDAAFSFSRGWAHQANGNDYAHSHTVSGVPGASARYTFVGKTAVAGFVTTPGSGYADIYLDGIRTHRLNLYSATNQFRHLITVARYASPGHHTLIIKVVGIRPAASRGTNVYLDSLSYS